MNGAAAHSGTLARYVPNFDLLKLQVNLYRVAWSDLKHYMSVRPRNSSNIPERTGQVSY